MLYKTVFKFSLFFFPVLAALVLVFYILMPLIAETLAMRQIEANEELSGLMFDIESIGLSGLHVRNIRKGKGIKADSIFIGYSLESLADRRIDRIEVSGLRLDLNSLETPEKQAPQKEFDLKSLLEPLLPYVGKVGAVEVTNSALNMNAQGRSFHIPLKARLDFDTKNRKMVLSGHVFPFSQKVDFIAATDFTGVLERVEAVAEDFPTGLLSPLLSRIAPRFSFSGDTDIRAVKKPGEAIRVALSKIQIEKPAPVKVKNVDAKITVGKGDIGFSGSFAAQNDFVPPVRMKIRGSFKPADGNRFSLYAENLENENLTAEYNGRQVVLENPRFSVQINSASSKVSAFCNAGADRIGIPKEGIELYGANVRIPVRFPFQEDVKTGGFNVSKCVLNGGVALGVKGTFRQTRRGADINGSVEVLSAPEIECGFSGTGGLNESGNVGLVLQFSADRTRVTEKTLKPFVKDRLDGMIFEAFVGANGKIRYSEGKLESSLTVNIRDGNLTMPETGLELANFETLMEFDDALELESRPARTARIERIAMKKMVLEDAQITYTIESPESVLVENVNFKWCGGNVSAESFRVIPDKSLYSLVLYCDRLRLADLLETVAGFEASGEGTLSGRIPLRFDQGDISFRDAFLFTSPGAGGHIRLKNSSVITKGIPEETARYTQMDLAREALKNYEYKWAKLFFDTKGEKLNVKLRFDGKPADVLPFEYNRELGRFSRVDASSRGSRFQGIKIDVNLTLPFNQVLKYGKELDKLF